MSSTPRVRGWVALTALLLTAACTATDKPGTGRKNLPYMDAKRPVAERVADLLGRMDLTDKIGQMTQAEREAAGPDELAEFRLGSILSGGGSVPSPNTPAGWADMVDAYQKAALGTPLGIPMIYGADAVHGHNNVYGATIFPHNIGLGATRDPGLAKQIGGAVAEEIAGTGVQWDFAPCVCVARDDRWGRTYESFGEKPELAVQMSDIILGLQGTALGAQPPSVLATAKHYMGDGGTTNGKDQGDTEMSEADLRAVHLPPYEAAVRKGVGSVMVSFSSFNGHKMHADKHLVTDVLKGELGFTGFVVSDWNGLDQIDGAQGLSPEDVRQGINAGIDMVMVPTAWKSFVSILREEVQGGRVSQERIDDAVKRILTKKFELGLFEHPLTNRDYAATVGNAAHRDLARRAVAASQVLLKNEGKVLPLAAADNKIFVAGKNADDIGNQSGGWTLSWQGSPGRITEGTTILQGIKASVDPSTTVTYDASGKGIDSSYKAAVAVIGETPYAEYEGDRPDSLRLDQTDLDTLAALRASGVPVIVVLVSGRPLDVSAQLGGWKALVAAWLPGSEGQGVADVLFGRTKPGGKLPVTWPRSTGQEPINDGDGKAPLFPFGYGLSY